MIEKKKTVSIIACVLIAIFFCGCETCKGIGQGIAQGAPQDWQALIRADNWIKKNLW